MAVTLNSNGSHNDSNLFLISSNLTFKVDIILSLTSIPFISSSSLLPLFQFVSPDFPAVLLLVSVLFVDVGDEEEAGPLRRFQNSRERCKFLAPSISVSVPEDDPYHSDEEYYEHPLFSPEWTHSGSRPTGQAVAFRQIEGEPRMVPLCRFSPSFLSRSFPLTFSLLFNTNFSSFLCDLTSSRHPPLLPSFRLFVRQFDFVSVTSSSRPSVCVLVSL